MSATYYTRRAFNHTSSEALLTIEQSATTISNTASAIMYFIEALDQVEFGEEEVVFL